MLLRQRRKIVCTTLLTDARTLVFTRDLLYSQRRNMSQREKFCKAVSILSNAI